MKTELHKSRPMPTEEPGPVMNAESRALQKQKASSCMIIKFNDGNVRSKWSNEWKQPYKFRHIGDSVNEHMRIFDQYFRRNAHSAVIFDTREQKTFTADNKIYQFEKGTWNMVKPFHW